MIASKKSWQYHFPGYSDMLLEKDAFETIEINTVEGVKEIEICTGESWHNFEAGDEIQYESSPNNYRSKVFVVRGFNLLYGMFAEDLRYEGEYMLITSPIGIILRRRDRYDFCVGKASIIGIYGKVADRIGKIVALNPKVDKFLVRFRNDFEEGHNGKSDWKKPWYPRKCKIEDAKNLYWCLYEQIKHHI